MAWFNTEAASSSRAVSVCRVLLWVAAAFCGVQVFALVLAAGVSAPVVGAAVWTAAPGVASALCARRLSAGPAAAGSVVWRWVFWLQVFTVVAALGVVGSQDPRGLTELALPITVLVASRRQWRRQGRWPWRLGRRGGVERRSW